MKPPGRIAYAENGSHKSVDYTYDEAGNMVLMAYGEDQGHL